MYRKDIRDFVLPFYAKNDEAHHIDHADAVCDLALKLNEYAGMPENVELVMLASYLHDIYALERKKHNELSFRFVTESDAMEISRLSPSDRKKVAMACLEHRSSYRGEFYSPLSEIISSADRGYPDYEKIFERSKSYAYSKEGCSTEAEAVEHAEKHMVEKYGAEGYAYYPELYRKYFRKELKAMQDRISLEIQGIEPHPLEPFLPSNARILMLGSFPPPKKRWSIDFFYPNYNNDMWRVMGLIFYEDKDYFCIKDGKRFDYDKVVAFCKEKGIAIYDTASAVKRLKNNASDKDLEIVRRTDVAGILLSLKYCNILVTTGQKASDVVSGIFGCNVPKVGEHTEFVLKEFNTGYAAEGVSGRKILFYRMPSTSRAYPVSINKKVLQYKKLF